jgi:type II secretory ATPase GspE/PulE/Tfp pilus assembly ATPase PilB-like protein
MPEDQTPVVEPVDEVVSENDAAKMEVYSDMEERGVEIEAERSGNKYVNLKHLVVNPDVIAKLSTNRAEMEKAKCLPYYVLGSDKVRVAVVSLTDGNTVEYLNALRERGFKIASYICSLGGFTSKINDLYATGILVDIEKEEAEVYDESGLGSVADVLETLKGLSEIAETEKPNVVVYKIMVGSIKTKASDVHIEAYEEYAKVRYRIDGILHDVSKLSKKAFDMIIQEIKFEAKMKMNVTQVPQDGRYSFEINERKIDVRVSNLPTSYGESVVMRLLDSGKALISLDILGFEGKALELVTAAMKEPTGMMLTTGPTGSGKTSTLYAILNELNQEDVKIITLENPIEFYLDGVVQSQINHEKGYDFSKGLRSILRQDPDVVMVGEIRDLETAEIASQAALTGHKVLSTLHTNNAIGVISRFINMGLERFMIGPSLKLVIAQRLLRRVCGSCKTSYEPNDELKKFFVKNYNTAKIVDPSIPEMGEHFKGAGCEECSNTGYKGRLGIYEVFGVDAKMQEMIVAGASEGDLLEYVRAQGMLSLVEDGIRKVVSGVTTLEEVIRVAGESESSEDDFVEGVPEEDLPEEVISDAVESTGVIS